MSDTSKREFSPKTEQRPHRETSAFPPTASEPQGFIASVSEKAKDVAATAGEAVGQVKDTVQGWASTTADRVGEAKDKVQEWASTATDETGRAMKSFGQELTALVRRYPIPALLIGLGFGFMLARMTSNRR